FFPTLNLTATDNTFIQAHGGDIIQNGSFYWFGEDKTDETTSGHFIGVNCYSSSDFVSWESHGAVLSPIAGTAIASDSVVERPKVIYNDANDEYVMWFHSDTSNYGAAEVGVATSKTIDGQYSWLGSFKPFGNDSRDMTVWKDDDGTAYLVFATANNANLEIASLTADYHNVSKSIYTWSDKYWEAPGIFKIDGTYHLLYSRQDGWTPTDNYYMTATSLSGPWSDPVLLAPEGYYAYNTQNAYDITVQGSVQPLYIYYGDHWNAQNLGSSTYSFYPV
ncbi:glycosyl hydrolase, partial [Delphinella strobiligena]